MHCIAAILLCAFCMGANTKELEAKYMTNEQGNILYDWVDRLFDRTLTASSMRHRDLDSTTSGKPVAAQSCCRCSVCDGCSFVFVASAGRRLSSAKQGACCNVCEAEAGPKAAVSTNATGRGLARVEKTLQSWLAPPTEEKRVRKQVETLDSILKLEKAKVVPPKPLIIPAGQGRPIAEIPNVAFRLSKIPQTDEFLKTLHRLMYKRTAKATVVKRNIRAFKGYAYPNKDAAMEAEKEHELLLKLNSTRLNRLLHLFDLQQDVKKDDKKEAKVARILAFLRKPAPRDGAKSAKTTDAASKKTSASAASKVAPKKQAKAPPKAPAANARKTAAKSAKAPAKSLQSKMASKLNAKKQTQGASKAAAKAPATAAAAKKKLNGGAAPKLAAKKQAKTAPKAAAKAMKNAPKVSAKEMANKLAKVKGKQDATAASAKRKASGAAVAPKKQAKTAPKTAPKTAAKSAAAVKR
eukprot:gnl/TRDRNA2_/TRDRNA2_33743_c0_seq1.p1 gnl/TRDRNA2_/TRDRNA2_33743_c0~~gnl/TRDRNA2_/TRDRNA2_33743_c0_seq1.p1  ORF type:complete len:466 (+),score=131.37 gnl/TRDRNA2_/TRDRNA2_33743_c0_seq1:70-1467(+)